MKYYQSYIKIDNNSIKYLTATDFISIGIAYILFTYSISFLISRLELPFGWLKVLSGLITPLPTIVFITIWRKIRRLSSQELGFCSPNGNQFLIITASIFLAFSLRIFDPKFTINTIRYANWSDFSIIGAVILPLTLDFGRIFFFPITEEVIFRGVFFGYLTKKLDWRIALIIQALLFTFVHPQIYGNGYKLFQFYFLVGIATGSLKKITNSIYPPFICHSAVNFFGKVLDFIRYTL